MIEIKYKMEKLVNNLAIRFLENINNIVCVGAGTLAREFSLECKYSYPEIYKRILYFMDDNTFGNKILEKEIFPLSKNMNEDIIYLILISDDSAIMRITEKLLFLDVARESIFTLEEKYFLTNLLLDNYILNDFNVIECGAYGGTPQIFSMKERLTNKLNIYAFEADKEEVTNLQDKSNSKYFFFNKIIDNENNKSRQLYKITSSGSWTFHKPNFEIQDKYFDTIIKEKHEIFDTTIFNDTVTIDTIIKDTKKQINYLYINIDSAEYYALEGAKKSLKNKLIDFIEVEVYFNEWFKNQPLFDEVNNLMKNSDYELLTLRKPNNITPLNSPFLMNGEKLIHYNAVYIKKENTNNSEKLLKEIVILELLDCPLKAIYGLKELYLNTNDINEKSKLKKILLETFNKYKTKYEELMSFNDFIEKN